MVVVPEPAVKGSGAFGARAVDGGVGPAVEQGADEAFGFAVCLGPVGAGAQVLEPQLTAGDRVDDRAVGGAVVAEDRLDPDAVAAVEGGCAAEEAGGSGCLLVGEHFGVGEAAVVVDGDVHVLVADGGAAVAVLVGEGAVVVLGAAAD